MKCHFLKMFEWTLETLNLPVANRGLQERPTCCTSADTSLRMWSWAGSGTRPVRHHSDWSFCEAHSTVCATLPDIPASHRTSFWIQGASVPGRSPWVWVVLCSASEPPFRILQAGRRPWEHPSLPDCAPSYPQQLMFWLIQLAEVVARLYRKCYSRHNFSSVVTTFYSTISDL